MLKIKFAGVQNAFLARYIYGIWDLIPNQHFWWLVHNARSKILLTILQIEISLLCWITKVIVHKKNDDKKSLLTQDCADVIKIIIFYLTEHKSLSILYKSVRTQPIKQTMSSLPPSAARSVYASRRIFRYWENIRDLLWKIEEASELDPKQIFDTE